MRHTLGACGKHRAYPREFSSIFESLEGATGPITFYDANEDEFFPEPFRHRMDYNDVVYIPICHKGIPLGFLCMGKPNRGNGTSATQDGPRDGMQTEGSATARLINEVLSPREKHVLRQVTTGASNSEIARKLFISTGTVKMTLQSILRKLNVRNRVEAVVYAVEAGFRPIGS